MKISHKEKIGTHFNKEKIFLATISNNSAETKEILKSKVNKKIPEFFLSFLIDKNAIFSEQFDIFYKNSTGYTRFVEEGPETFAGDNSDGKGFICNIVPIWNYYSEDEVFECILNDSFMAICITKNEPLYKYNSDYNKA